MQPRGFFFLRRLSSRFVPRWLDEKKTKEETRHVSQWESNCAAQGTFVLPHRSLHCFPALSRTKERNRGLDSSDLSLNRFFEGVLDGLLISVRSTDEEKSHREKTRYFARTRSTTVLFSANNRAQSGSRACSRFLQPAARKTTVNEYIYTCFSVVEQASRWLTSFQTLCGTLKLLRGSFFLPLWRSRARVHSRNSRECTWKRCMVDRYVF